MFNAVYILAKVDYPSKVVKTYFSDKDVIVDIQIEQLFQITQDERAYRDWETDRKSTRLNSSHSAKSRMPSSA